MLRRRIVPATHYLLQVLNVTRTRQAWLLLAPLFVACLAASGCEGSCDEEARCSQGKFANCSYDGCGQLACLAIYVEGHVVCNEDGTEGCSSWPTIDEDCATAFSAPKDQAGCTELLLAVLGGTPASNATACRGAVLDAAPCALGDDGELCDFAPIDAACFDDPPECE